MKRKLGIFSSALAIVAVLSVFAGAAAAGGNGNGNGNSANAPGQVKKDATATSSPAPQAATQTQTPSTATTHGNSASAPGHASTPTTSAKPATASKPAAKPVSHSTGSASQNSSSVPGMKPTNQTAQNPTHLTTVGASPNVSKRYGNGQTAADIAKSRGASDDTVLYGPGNSQPHKVSVCGKANGHYVDVHAVKSYTNTACTTSTQQPAPQVQVSQTCGSVTTTTTSVVMQRGHAYGLLKQGKPLHSKTVTATVTLPTGEVCTVTAPTKEAVQQQASQILTQVLGQTPTQQQVAAAVQTQQSTTKTSSSTPAKSGVLGAAVVKKSAAAAASPKRSRSGVLGAFYSAGNHAVHGTLPFTGFPLWAAVVVAAVLVAIGLALMRRRAPRDVV